ncbi:MAG: AAA family ATPase [Limnochordia bacterium]|jgi:chloramphenicol 3-O-phosphotransferase
MRVVVLRGPIAVGKTSVAQELTRFFDKSAIVPVDWLRHMVGGWRPESESEMLLAAKNAAALAQNFAAAGYCAIIDGPFDYSEALSELLSGLGGQQVEVVTLIASWDEVLRRHNKRPENHRAELSRVTSVYQHIVDNRDIGGVWVNTDSTSAAEIAKKIAARYVHA